MAKIREVSKNAGPKGVISKVYAELGGVVGASDSCTLPRNEQQLIKVKSRSKSAILPSSTPNDEFTVVMHHAHLEDCSNQFI